MFYPAPPSPPGPPGLLEQTHVRVTYHDTDQMGHVYYGKYLIWFEMGRTEWLRSRGGCYGNMEKAGVYLPVAEAHCEYLKPAIYDEVVTIVTWIAELRRVSLTFGYEIRRLAVPPAPSLSAPAPAAQAPSTPTQASGAGLEPPKRAEIIQADEILARGWTRHAFVDRNRKIVKAQGEILQILQAGLPA